MSHTPDHYEGGGGTDWGPLIRTGVKFANAIFGGIGGKTSARSRMLRQGLALIRARQTQAIETETSADQAASIAWNAVGPIRDMPWARDLMPTFDAAVWGFLWRYIKAGRKKKPPKKKAPDPNEIDKILAPVYSPTPIKRDPPKPKPEAPVLPTGRNLMAEISATVAATMAAIFGIEWLQGEKEIGEKAETPQERQKRIIDEAWEAEQRARARAAEARREEEYQREKRQDEARERREIEEAERRKKREDAEEARRAAASAPGPAGAPKPFWQVLLGEVSEYYTAREQARASRSSTSVNLSGPIPSSGTQSSSLTSFYSTGVASGPGGACECPPKKKRGPRKRRDVCYSGTYIERADGLTKSRKRKVQCRPSKGKQQSRQAR